jgi:hypothetical protein
MNVFTVDSAQCTIHRKALYKDGPNAVYEKMKRGRKRVGKISRIVGDAGRR